MRLASYLVAATALTFGLTPNAEAAGSGFVVTASESGDQVKVLTDAGIHVNADAPVFLQAAAGPTLAGVTLSDDGDAAWRLGVPLSPGVVTRLEFALCDDAETWCRFYKIAFEFNPSAPEQITFQSGASIAAPPSEGPGHHPGLLSFAIQDDAQAAFDKARDEDKLVLMDFHAVWCPPCQQLAAEGMTDPDIRALVDELVVVQLDADKPASWNAKSRYAVRGYPTIILARSGGQEIARLEGYPGVEEFHRWLKTSTQSRHSLRELAQMRANGDRSPQTLTALARQMESLGLSEEAAALWAEALPQLSGPDAIDARLALLVDAASRGDKKAVKTQAKALNQAPPNIRIAYEFYGAGRALPDDQDKLGDYLSEQGLLASERVLTVSGLGPMERADAHDGVALFQHALGNDDASKAASSRAADAYLEALAAQPGEGAERFAAFRGPARSLTGSLNDAGRLEEAEALHKELAAAFPDEVTYFYDYARFLKGQERYEEAEVQARSAVAHAHGDNLLWSTSLLADLLATNGKTDEAVQLLEKTLASAPVPDDPTIRTHRYVGRLKTQLESLKGGGQASL